MHKTDKPPIKTGNFQQAVTEYLSAKSLLAQSKDLDRILYAKAELKKAIHELTKFSEIETDQEKQIFIFKLLNN